MNQDHVGSRSVAVAGFSRGLVLLGLAISAGCAVIQRPTQMLNHLSAQREQRKQEVLSDFEDRRRQAQLSAALDRWHQNDAAGCEVILTQLLEQQPDHKEATQALADLYTELGRTDEAMKQLEQLVEHSPDDAQAHHSLGLLLESAGHYNQALAHFRLARKLEPTNEVYALCERTCTENGATLPLPQSAGLAFDSLGTKDRNFND